MKRGLIVVATVAVASLLLLVFLWPITDRQKNGPPVQSSLITPQPQMDNPIERLPARHATRSKTAPVARPLDGTAEDELHELRGRAAHGDVAAASELASDSNHCEALEATLAVMDIHLGQDLTQLTLEQMQRYEEGLKKIDERLVKFSGFCQRNGRRLIEERLTNLLQAAELGDLAARQCFASAASDLTGSRLQDEDKTRFLRRAREFLETDVEAGSWSAVRQLYAAYSAPAYFRRDTGALVVIPNPREAYKYGRLLQIGGAANVDDAPVTAVTMDALKAALPPDEAAAGDEWANSVFLTRFTSQPLYEGGAACN